MFWIAARPLGAQSRSELPPSYLDGFVGIVFPIQNEEFFQQYQKLGSATRSFAPAVIAGGTTVIEISPGWWVGVSVSYHEIRLREFHQQVIVQNDSLTLFRTFWEDLAFKVTQAAGRLEWSPHLQQFRTHLGAQLGIASVKSFWYEGVSSPFAQLRYPGGIRLSDEALVPALKIFAQVALGFDRVFSSRSWLHALLIEAAYSYLPLKSAVFRNFPPQSPLASARSVRLNLGGLSLSIGVRLRF